MSRPVLAGLGDYIPCKGCGTHVGVMEYDVWPGVTVDLCGDCYDKSSEALG